MKSTHPLSSALSLLPQQAWKFRFAFGGSFVEGKCPVLCFAGCATTVLVTGAGIGEMVLQLLVGSIIHDRGSYSFLVCGMIFGCLAFTFYALLVFFHRMYPKPCPELDEASQEKAAVPEDTGQYQR